MSSVIVGASGQKIEDGIQAPEAQYDLCVLGSTCNLSDMLRTYNDLDISSADCNTPSKIQVQLQVIPTYRCLS